MTNVITLPGSSHAAKIPLVERLRERLATHRAFLATLRELDSLSDRDLDDIGVARCDLRAIAWETARRR